MATMTVSADCPARLAGFLEGVRFINDSGVSVLWVDETRCQAALIDQDMQDDQHWQLGASALLMKTDS